MNIYQQIMLVWFGLVLVWGFKKLWTMRVNANRAEAFDNGYQQGHADGMNDPAHDAVWTQAYDRGYREGIGDERLGVADDNLKPWEKNHIKRRIARYQEQQRRVALLIGVDLAAGPDRTYATIIGPNGQIETLTAPQFTLHSVPDSAVKELIAWQDQVMIQAAIAQAVIAGGAMVDLEILDRDAQAIRNRVFQNMPHDYALAAALVSAETIKHAAVRITQAIAA